MDKSFFWRLSATNALGSSGHYRTPFLAAVQPPLHLEVAPVIKGLHFSQAFNLHRCILSKICALLFTLLTLSGVVWPVWIWLAQCSWCYLTDLRKWLHFHQAQVRACLQIVTHFVVQSDPIMTWPWRLKMPTQYQMVDVFESHWQVVCSKISFWWLSVYLAHLILSEIMICVAAVIARKSDKAV